MASLREDRQPGGLPPNERQWPQADGGPAASEGPSPKRPRRVTDGGQPDPTNGGPDDGSARQPAAPVMSQRNASQPAVPPTVRTQPSSVDAGMERTVTEGKSRAGTPRRATARTPEEDGPLSADAGAYNGGAPQPAGSGGAPNPKGRVDPDWICEWLMCHGPCWAPRRVLGLSCGESCGCCRSHSDKEASGGATCQPCCTGQVLSAVCWQFRGAAARAARATGLCICGQGSLRKAPPAPPTGVAHMSALRSHQPFLVIIKGPRGRTRQTILNTWTYLRKRCLVLARVQHQEAVEEHDMLPKILGPGEQAVILYEVLPLRRWQCRLSHMEALDDRQ